MGWVTMRERDLQRIEVLTEVLSGRRTVDSAATVLEISPRQTRRLLNRYQDRGGSALIHQARGRKSNHRLQDFLVETVRSTISAIALSAFVFAMLAPSCLARSR